jgi:tripartite-type tricarboxylate transporter receptor subunit TctC
MLTTQATAGVLLNAVTGIPAKIVVGFKNSERLKVILAGDADFYTAAADKELAPLLKSGDVQSLYRIVGEDFLPDIDASRTLEAFLVPNAPAAVVDFIKAARGMGRAFLAAPSLSKEDVSALRKAFEATLSDPAFIAEAEAMAVPVTAVPAARIAEDIGLMMPEDPAVKAEIDKAYACGLAMSEGRQKACAF